VTASASPRVSSCILSPVSPSKSQCPSRGRACDRDAGADSSSPQGLYTVLKGPVCEAAPRRGGTMNVGSLGSFNRFSNWG
jgi:hypothetical protein